MFIVVGGTGHVGTEVALALLERGKKVTVVGHDEAKRDEWTRRGAAFTSVDIRNVRELRNTFARGRRAFLLNPPTSPATDVDAEERRGG